jgi:hypothetical protein
MDWQRLQRGYQDDDKIVALRLSHGYPAEVFHTRFIAHGEAVKCPKDREFEVLALSLGFGLEEAAQIRDIALEALELALCTRRNTSSNVTVWDLRRRSKYRGPKSATREYEREKKRRQRASNVPEHVPGQSPNIEGDIQGTASSGEMDPHRSGTMDVPELSPGHETDVPPYERTNVRTDVRTNKIPPYVPPLIWKYLERLKASAPRTFGPLTPERLLEIAADEGISPDQAGRFLADVWDWWRTAPNSKRWKRADRGWRTWCRREASRQPMANGSTPKHEAARQQTYPLSREEREKQYQELERLAGVS